MILKSFLPNLTSNATKAVTKVHTERKVLQNILPLHLFRIIQDVDKYSEFLPFCTYSKILQKYGSYDTSTSDGRLFFGKLHVGIPPMFGEEYVSRVTVIPETLTINATSVESKLFDSLSSSWTLQQVPATVYNNNNNDSSNIDSYDMGLSVNDENDSMTPNTTHNINSIDNISCLVDFKVELSVSDPIIIATLDSILEKVASKQVVAFEQRCHDIPIPHDILNIYNKNTKQR